MYKIILCLIFCCSFIYPQTYKAEKITGSVKAQVGLSESWVEIKDNTELKANTVIMTEKNSSIRLRTGDLHFILKESSALPLSSLKKMSTDELLLALAMEEIIDAPKNKEENKSQSTAVYGTKEGKSPSASDDKENFNGFGMKRIKGAMQLAESGFKESAVVTAKEIFRKYPETKKQGFYRIYFADILYKCGLYNEAYDEFSEIKKLSLSEQEKDSVQNKLNLITKKLTSY